MKVLAQKIWNEPAAGIGLLVSMGLLALAILTEAPWDASTIAGIVAPLASGLGIRQFVRPIPPTAASEQESPKAVV